MNSDYRDWIRDCLPTFSMIGQVSRKMARRRECGCISMKWTGCLRFLCIIKLLSIAGRRERERESIKE